MNAKRRRLLLPLLIVIAVALFWGLLESVTAANPAPEASGRFIWPTGSRSVCYNVDAPVGKWVITAVDQRAVDRDYERWPRIEGTRLPSH